MQPKTILISFDFQNEHQATIVAREQWNDTVANSSSEPENESCTHTRECIYTVDMQGQQWLLQQDILACE